MSRLRWGKLQLASRALWGRMVSCAPVGNRRPAAAGTFRHRMVRVSITATAAAALLALCILSVSSAQAPPPDPMFQAMRDEIDRARKLSLANLEAPYFVEYTIDEQESFSLSATLGGLLSRRKERFRLPAL